MNMKIIIIVALNLLHVHLYLPLLVIGGRNTAQLGPELGNTIKYDLHTTS